MLLEINENLWVDVNQIEVLKLEKNHISGYFKLKGSEDLYYLNQVDYHYLVAALKMFGKRKIAGEE